MTANIKRRFDSLIDHYAVICVFLALFITTLTGVGEVRIASILGLLLCIVGLVQPLAKVDLWVLVPVLVYQLVSMASSWAIYGNFVDGYASTQGILPVLYLLVGCLSSGERRVLKQACVIWAGVTAASGVGWFVCCAVTAGRVGRLSGFLGNPNAMGIFLVIGWFALLALREEQKDLRYLPYIEPFLLLAVALTLSMGSFAAMAVGIFYLLAAKKRRESWRETFRFACRLLAKASLGVGTGILLYLSATRTGLPWVCLPVLLYGLLAVALWPKFEQFLEIYPQVAGVISGGGLLVAASAVAIRSSSLATFTERLEMIRNGLHYLPLHPLLGVGPYQWRLLNLYDSDKYFGTWHIHNALLHVGVELGWVAMAILILLLVRFYQKKQDSLSKAGFTAFCIHNLMDTSFFYLGILSMTMLTVGSDEERPSSVKVSKLLFGAFAVMFAFNLYCCIRG